MSGRTLGDFGPLTEAEEKVIAGLGTGHVTVLGDGTVPGPEAGEDRQVRASLIRWLALGAPGDDAVTLHETGLRIGGALVVSDGQADPTLGDAGTPGLDLKGCTLDHDLALFACHFMDVLVLRNARAQTIILDGSALPGLRGDGLETRGSLFLRGVRATGEVRLLGARIGGDLDCRGGQFETTGGRALNVAGARVDSSFFWREGSSANGALDLTAAHFDTINDDSDCRPGPGDLLLDRCTYGAFLGKGISAAERIRWLDLQSPEDYGDDFWPQPWEQCAKVLREMGHAEDARQVLIAKEERQRRVKREVEAARLDGARFRKRLEVANSEDEARSCIDDLKSALEAFEQDGDPRRVALWEEVKSSTLLMRGEVARMSKDADALFAQVEAKVDRLGTRGALPLLAAQGAVTDAWLMLMGRRVRDGLLGLLIAYGLRPLRALVWLAGMWLVGAVIFGIVWGNEAFKPNNPFILRSVEWANCSPGIEESRWSGHSSRLDCFLDQPEAAGYPRFNGLLYSLDTLVPVVDLEVQDF